MFRTAAFRMLREVPSPSPCFRMLHLILALHGRFGRARGAFAFELSAFANSLMTWGYGTDYPKLFYLTTYFAYSRSNLSAVWMELARI